MPGQDSTCDLPFSEGDGPRPDRDATPAARVGEYEIIRTLGYGGMGVVYLARQQNPPREVALKLIRAAGLSDRAIRRFDQEARVLARLQHHGIAAIYESGVARVGLEDQPYIAMEYVVGSPLTDAATARALDVGDRVRLMIDVCDAVQHAHQKGVIHRDLKPANVLVNDEGRPKVLDFGLARLVDDDSADAPLSASGQVVGTLAYMSPEQTTGDPDAADARSDVYALGAILYELLSGRRPVEISGRDLMADLRAIRETPPTALGRIDPRLLGDLEAIAARAMEKRPADRYATASALADDLRRHLADEPIAARASAGFSYKARKFVRRHRAAVIGSALAAVALVAALGGLAYGQYQTALRAVEARNRESEGRAQALLATIDRARSALLLGSWGSARLEYDAALGLARRSPIDETARSLVIRSARFALDRIVALDGLNDTDAALAALKGLRDEVASGVVRPSPTEAGEILIRRAELSPNDEPGGSVESLVTKAREGPLRPEHAAYARGLIAPTAREAADSFREAWGIDRLLLRARVNDALARFLLGEEEQAREVASTTAALFPDDANVKMLLAVALAGVGREDEARAAIEPLRGEGKADLFAVASSAVDVVSGAFEGDQFGPKLEAKHLTATVDFAKRLKALPEFGSLATMPVYFIRYKDALARGGPLLLRVALGNINPLVTVKAELAALEEAERLVPGGVASLFLVMKYAQIGDQPGVERVAPGLLKRRVQIFGSRDALLQALVLAQLWHLRRDPSVPKEGVDAIPRVILEGIKPFPDRAFAANASGVLRACIAAADGTPEAYFVPMSYACWFTGDFDTSRQLLAEGLKRFPGNGGMRDTLDQIEAATGDPAAILRAAAAFARANRSNPHVPKLRRKARDRIDELRRLVEEAEREGAEAKPPAAPTR